MSALAFFMRFSVSCLKCLVLILFDCHEFFAIQDQRKAVTEEICTYSSVCYTIFVDTSYAALSYDYPSWLVGRREPEAEIEKSLPNLQQGGNGILRKLNTQRSIWTYAVTSVSASRRAPVSF